MTEAAMLSGVRFAIRFMTAATLAARRIKVARRTNR